MADIGSLEEIIKGPKSLARKKTEKSAPRGTRTTISPTQWDLIKYILGAVIIALLMGFVGVFASYFQFVQNTFQDYTKTIQNYNDKRYENLELRIKNIEINLTATPSAK